MEHRPSGPWMGLFVSAGVMMHQLQRKPSLCLTCRGIHCLHFLAGCPGQVLQHTHWFGGGGQVGEGFTVNPSPGSKALCSAGSEKYESWLSGPEGEGGSRPPLVGRLVLPLRTGS